MLTKRIRVEVDVRVSVGSLVLNLGSSNGISHNESHVCDVALSPTRAKGHVAERRAAAPRSPRHPEGVPMYIRAVIRRCVICFV